MPSINGDAAPGAVLNKAEVVALTRECEVLLGVDQRVAIRGVAPFFLERFACTGVAT